MHIQILCIGKIKEPWIAEGIIEFKKRLKPYGTIIITELSEIRIPDKATPSEETMVKEKEGNLLISAIKTGYIPITLDSHGKSISSEDLAHHLNEAKITGKNLCFIIGGPLGLSQSVLSSATKILSLSSLTFTHTMCRLILCEQIYRAFKIISGEPYHK